MNQLQVLFGKLHKTARKAARRYGYKTATLSTHSDSRVFICLWDGNDDIAVGGYTSATPKRIKQKILELSIEDKKNSQS